MWPLYGLHHAALTIAELPVDTEDAERWQACLAYIDEKIERSEVTAAQQQTFLRCWEACRQRYPKLRLPYVYFSNDEGGDEHELVLSWDSDDRNLLVEILIQLDGRLWRFVSDRVADASYSSSSEVMQEALSEDFYPHLEPYNGPYEGTT